MLVMFECFPDFCHVRAVDTNCFVQLLARDIEFLGPVMNVRTHLRIDLGRVVRAFFGREFPAFGEWF